MENYPKPAAALVATFVAQAVANPGSAAAFQGAPGAYSHMATLGALPEMTPLPCFTFEDALDALKSGRVAKAVIPIENSRHGRVADIHFLLPESGLFIVGEYFLRVRHCLMGLQGTRRTDIKEALSHTQALGQCRARLRGWGIQPVQYADTAGAAALVAETGNRELAAIASSLAGELYGLDILEQGIEDEDDNTTRFVLLAREPVDYDPAMSGALMTTAVFQVRSVPAALFKALGGFATNGVNLTKLESYLVGADFNAAQFYIDFDGSPRDTPVKNALEELGFYTKWVRILGTYPKNRAGLKA
jgi:prephenate dehydratase